MASIFQFGWPWLPPELFSEIFDRLSVVDRIRCRCVSRSWRCAAEKNPVNLHTSPPESPWLIFSDPIAGCNFYSVADNKLYRMNDALLPEPDIRKRSWVGSSGGWLITANERSDLHLLNPITRVQILLPSILSLPCIFAAIRDLQGHLTGYIFCSSVFFETEGSECSTQRTIEHLFCHGKGVVKWSTIDSNTCSWTVMLLFMPGPKLAYARSGDIMWTTIPGCLYDDLLLHDGLFYTLDCHFRVKVWDVMATGEPFPIRTINLEFRVPDYFRVFYSYLAVSSSRILLVRRERETPEDEDMYRTLSFEVYQLYDDGHELNWVRMQTLEDQALFIGLNSCISLSSNHFPELKRDCIYFSDDHWEGALYTREIARDIGVCSLKDETITPCYPQDIPKLNWPPPIWITPSLL